MLDNTSTTMFRRSRRHTRPVHPGAARMQQPHAPIQIRRMTTDSTRRFRADQIPQITRLATTSTGLAEDIATNPRGQRIIVDLLRGASRLPVPDGDPHGITGDLLTVMVVTDEQGEPQRILRGGLSLAAVSAFCDGTLTVPTVMLGTQLAAGVSDPARGLHISDVPRSIADDALRFAVYTAP